MVAKANDDIIDVTPEGERASLSDIFNFVADIAADTVSGMIEGATHSAADVLDGASCLCRGDVGGAVKIAGRRVSHMFQGAVGIVQSGAAVTSACCDTLIHDAPFVTDANKHHLTRLCQAGVTGVTADALFSDDAPSGSECPLTEDACDLPGVENGVFVGDASDLKALTAAGEVPDTDHVSEADITRSEATKAAFLNAHGIEETEGWQVHHVVPLSEGGADDIHNMVLINPEDHRTITAEHADYYHWQKKFG